MMIHEAPKWNDGRNYKRRQRDGGQWWRPPLVVGVLFFLYGLFFCLGCLLVERFLFRR